MVSEATATEPDPAKPKSSVAETAKSLLASIRDVGIVVAALMFFVGYVYDYSYYDYFGLTFGALNVPLQLIPADSVSVLLNNKTLLWLTAIAAAIVLAAIAAGADRRYNASHMTRLARAIPRAAVVGLALVCALLALAIIDDYAASLAHEDARSDEYQSVYWRFSFTPDAKSLDPLVTAANARGALRTLSESSDAYVALVTAGPRDAQGESAGGCVLLIPKRFVASVRIESLYQDVSGEGEQRYFSCGNNLQKGRGARWRR